jgi:hypothetical protein
MGKKKKKSGDLTNDEAMKILFPKKIRDKLKKLAAKVRRK